MKIALMLSHWGLGFRPLTFSNLWSNPRGLSGTDLAFVMYAQELSNLGHQIHLFTEYTDVETKIWKNVQLFSFAQRHNLIDDSFDVLISINEPDSLRGFAGKYLKICIEYLNDFSFAQPGYDDAVDLYLSPSEVHRSWMLPQVPHPEKWKDILPLGCDLNWYDSTVEKDPFKVAWFSSPDRGSHLLLQAWPEIKKQVPQAHLKVFYHLNPGILETFEPNDSERHPAVLELAQRIRWIQMALPKLKKLDVEHVGSVSRECIAQELSQTSIVVCPLSVVAPTEGFSVATLEALAAGCLPIIGKIDALNSIYGSAGCMVDSPVEKHLDDLVNYIVRGMTDLEWKNSVTKKCQELAQNLTWKKSTLKLEKIIQENLKK